MRLVRDRSADATLIRRNAALGISRKSAKLGRDSGLISKIIANARQCKPTEPPATQAALVLVSM